MNEETLRKSIYENLNLKDDDELLLIWRTNHRYEWSDNAFNIVAQIIRERGLPFLPQNEPIFEPEASSKPVTTIENEPVLYDPKKLMYLAKTASITAWIVLAVGIIYSISVLLLVHEEWPLVDAFFDFELLPGFLMSLVSSVVSFFMLKGLAMGLNILMEFEYNSRGVK